MAPSPRTAPARAPRTNWAGNLRFRSRRLLVPRSMPELQEMVAGSERLRPLGTAHSFNEIADTQGDQVSLAAMPRRLEVDPGAGTVTVDGGARLGPIAEALHAAGLALHMLPSLPHVSVAGACATATHGSGDRASIFPSAVVGMEVVRPDGALATIRRGDGSGTLAAEAVSLGALGVVAALTIRVEPSYDVRQVVFEGLPFQRFVEHFDEIAAVGDSVSFMTDWTGSAMHQVWVKRRVHVPQMDLPDEIHGAIAARRDLHPIPGLSARACTAQRGIPGPWHERLPHFRLSHTPSSGEELQSEYMVPRQHAAEAFLALLGLRRRLAELILVTEIRTIAPDDLWLSPASGRPSVSFHFTWRADTAGVTAMLPAVEAALGPFDPRPHWGKLFTMAPDEVRSSYPRMADFGRLARRLDPEGKVANEFLRRYVLES